MKFLCVECDQAMKLSETRGPEEGSLTVIFTCPDCGKSIGMLTNPMETQMVRSLGVKVGGRTVPAAPMETLRSSLATGGGAAPAEPTGDATAETGGEEGKCPFSGMVAAAVTRSEGEITWHPEAEERLEKIPAFIRPMVRKSIEQHAREKGYREIDAAVMDEMKHLVGMKYS